MGPGRGECAHAGQGPEEQTDVDRNPLGSGRGPTSAVVTLLLTQTSRAVCLAITSCAKLGMHSGALWALSPALHCDRVSTGTELEDLGIAWVFWRVLASSSRPP